MKVGPQHLWHLFQMTDLTPATPRLPCRGVWTQLRNGHVTGTAGDGNTVALAYWRPSRTVRGTSQSQSHLQKTAPQH